MTSARVKEPTVSGQRESRAMPRQPTGPRRGRPGRCPPFLEPDSQDDSLIGWFWSAGPRRPRTSNCWCHDMKSLCAPDRSPARGWTGPTARCRGMSLDLGAAAVSSTSDSMSITAVRTLMRHRQRGTTPLFRDASSRGHHSADLSHHGQRRPARGELPLGNGHVTATMDRLSTARTHRRRV
jgi:hypothetical protein